MKSKSKKCLIPNCTGEPQADSPHCAKHQPKLPLDTLPRIEDGFFIQGSVKFKIDPDNMSKTLSSGQYERDGCCSKLGETTIKRWAEICNLPTKPYHEDGLLFVLRGVLQNAWLEAFESGPSASTIRNQEERVRKFLEGLKSFGEKSQEKAERLRASGHAFQKQPEVPWRATAKLTAKVVAEIGGQQKPILEWLLKNSGTKSEIAAAVEKKLTTKQGAEKVVAHYLPEWKKKGWIA